MSVFLRKVKPRLGAAGTVIALGLGIALAVVACAIGVNIGKQTAGAVMPTPWNCVGGCGAGGSGGGSAGIRWVGEGVSGGRVRLECLPKYNIGENFSFLTMAPRLTVNLTWN